MLDQLVTSKTRVRILMRLFMSTDNSAYLRELAGEFGTSPSQIKGELDQLREVGLLKSEPSGRQLNFRANPSHPLFPELQSMVRKALGMDRIVDSIVRRLGDLDRAFITGECAEGKDSEIVDVVLVGNVDAKNLTDLTRKTENYIGRKIRILVLSREEYSKLCNTLAKQPSLLLWTSDE